MAQQQDPQGATPNVAATELVSNTGMAAAAVGFVGAAYFLATGKHLSPDQMQALLSVAVGLLFAVGFLANWGSKLAKRAALRNTQQKVENLAVSTAEHVLETAGGVAAAKILDSVGALGVEQPVDVLTTAGK